MKDFKGLEGKPLASYPGSRAKLTTGHSGAGKKVTIMGLGLHGGGVGVTKFFCKQKAKVLITDLKTEKELKESVEKLKGLPIKFSLGGHKEKDFLGADLIIKNPDIPQDSPFLKLAREKGIPVKTDIGIFFDLFRGEIIGITGTKGKSTVATLTYEFLKKKDQNTALAGNIGLSPLELLLEAQRPNRVVLELSSFELEDLRKSPKIAVITNILKDHLNRYKSFEDYIKAKKEIFLHQKKEDILVLNYDDEVVREFSSEAFSKVYFFSKKEILKNGCFIKGDKIYFNKEPICRLEDIQLKGKHNIFNILAAVSVAKLLKVKPENIEEVLREFKGIPFRQELIAEIRGVKFFNDTTATIPAAVIFAINNLSSQGKLILIAGGVDKNLEYGNLAKKIKEKVSYLILLPGTATNKLKKELTGFSKVFFANSMREAVRKSFSLAKKGDIVLLSPGAASFNLFKNEFDRGEKFNKEVKACEARHKG